ncbi:MAG: SDR family NAD(P)-dependent oxidoreductase, partial [Eubacteriales bacterium]
MNRAVFVTGAASGTGYAIASRYAGEGYDVFITSRDGKRAEEAAASISTEYAVFARGFALDIRDEACVVEIFREIDGLGRFVETVVLNAADLGFGTDPARGMDFFSVSNEEFGRVFETNLVWNFMIVRQ